MATRTAVIDGLWSAVGTWDTGVPVSGDIAVIPSPRIVTFDVDQTGFASGVNVQIAGTLQITTTPGTYLLKANANITGAGSLLGGSSSTPLPSTVTMTFSFNGAFGINMTGTVALYGASVANGTIRLNAAEAAGQTVLSVDTNVSASTGWANGALVRIDDVNGLDSESRVFSSATATEITITSGLTNAKISGALVHLISRNIKIVGVGTGNGINTLSNGILQDCEIRAQGNGVAASNANTFTNCTFSGNTNGSNTNNACKFTNCTFSGNSNGVISDSASIFTNCTLSGNSNGSIREGACVFINCTLSGNSDGAFGNNACTFTNCTLSGNTRDLRRDHDCIYYNCLFSSPIENFEYNIRLYENPWNITQLIDYEQVAGDFKFYTLGGATLKNSSTLVAPRGTQSYKTTLESATYPGFWQRRVTVEGGQRLSFTAWLRKSATMTTRPRVQVFLTESDPLITGAAPLSENIMTDSVDTWESFGVSLANTASYAKEYIIRFQGQNASGTMDSDLLLQRDIITTREFDMYLRTGDTASFSAIYLDSATLLAKTGLTVTVDIYRDGTQLVNDGAASEVGDGLYKYDYASTSIAGIYRAVFKTTAAGVVVNVMADRAQVGGWVDLLSAGDVTLLSPLTADGGTMTVEQGDDYKDVDGRAFNWTLPSPVSGSGVWKFGTVSVFSKAITILSSTSVRLELTRAETLTFKKGLYDFQLEFVLSNGDTITPLEGRLLVRKNIG